MSDVQRPGDDGQPGDALVGEDVCPDCSGSGQRNGDTCQTCAGTGRIDEGIGGAWRLGAERRAQRTEHEWHPRPTSCPGPGRDRPLDSRHEEADMATDPTRKRADAIPDADDRAASGARSSGPRPPAQCSVRSSGGSSGCSR